MIDMSHANVKAESQASFRSLAIGNFMWDFTNDFKCGQGNYSTILSFTTCTNQEFTCNDGFCINIGKR